MIKYWLKYHRYYLLNLYCYKKIREANIPKKYVADEMVMDGGFSVLITGYSTQLNNGMCQLEYNVWRLNVYGIQPSKVVNLIGKECDQKITVASGRILPLIL